MARPLLLFAHGAGAPSSHPWMRSWAERLATLGRIVPFDYAYARAGRRSPDRLPKLIQAHREALAAARRRHRGPVVLVGKSMGGRVGCHVALEEPVDALVCMGYPLRGAGPRAPLRDEVLRELETPILFVQGTRDRLCPPELLAGVRRRMSAPSELCTVDAGDHSLRVTKTRLREAGETQDDVDARILAAIGAFLDGAL